MTSCRLGQIRERIHLPIPKDIAALLFQQQGDASTETAMMTLMKQVQKVYDDVLLQDDHSVMIQQLVTLSMHQTEEGLAGIYISWSASPGADMIADSVVGLITQLLSAPQLVRRAVLQASRGVSAEGVNAKRRTVPIK